MSAKVTLTIDEKEIRAANGDILLWTALENGIYIPNLCAVKEREMPAASCRLCFVEVEGKKKPVTACTQPVAEGMVVNTRSPRVDRLVKTAFELLISDHRLGCSKCPKNKSCELQKIAKERGFRLKSKRLKRLPKKEYIDDSAELFIFDRSRCVLCERCVWMDRHVVNSGVLGFSRRGIERSVTTFMEKKLAQSPCAGKCGKCVEVCPVGALSFKDKSERENGSPEGP